MGGHEFGIERLRQKATVNDDLHLATLISLHFGFIDVRPAREVLDLLKMQ